MGVDANTARCSPSLRINILVAEGRIGPRPAGTYINAWRSSLPGKQTATGRLFLWS